MSLLLYTLLWLQLDMLLLIHLCCKKPEPWQIKLTGNTRILWISWESSATNNTKFWGLSTCSAAYVSGKDLANRFCNALRHHPLNSIMATDHGKHSSRVSKTYSRGKAKRRDTEWTQDVYAQLAKFFFVKGSVLTPIIDGISLHSAVSKIRNLYYYYQQ
jgi:hypothetical protein